MDITAIMLHSQNIVHLFWQAKISDLQKFEELPSFLLSIIVIQFDHLRWELLRYYRQGWLPWIDDELETKDIAKAKKPVVSAKYHSSI